MDVIVDGVPYVRVDSVSHNKIGIAITTHNRPQVLANSLEQHRKHLPPGAVVFVIDDGSNPPAKVPEWCNLIRHDKSRGIVASKNSSLECLMDSGCEHLFLWDDDAYAIADNWHLPYIESPELHLAYQFLDLAGQNKLNDLSVLYRDDQHVAYTGQRGVMLYYHRSAIEKVGGFDRVYGRGMYEHSDLALRIHNAGLTTWAYGDVVGSEKLIHSLDEHEAVERSVPRPDRQALVERNVKIHNERRDAGFTGYVEYRQQRDVVITTLLTSQPDPQRGTKMAASPDMLAKWASSLRNCGRIALVDELHA
ncbi:TPA: glycosyltransferase family 2 protein, partial [Enterobacter hormaechei]|nr:glycosyltransferase family 2 protein [Enterobacter hormaechei]